MEKILHEILGCSKVSLLGDSAHELVQDFVRFDLFRCWCILLCGIRSERILVNKQPTKSQVWVQGLLNMHWKKGHHHIPNYKLVQYTLYNCPRSWKHALTFLWPMHLSPSLQLWCVSEAHFLGAALTMLGAMSHGSSCNDWFDSLPKTSPLRLANRDLCRIFVFFLMVLTKRRMKERKILNPKPKFPKYHPFFLVGLS